MSDAPDKMWRETIAPSKMYPNGGSFYYEKHNPATVYTIEYHRADLPTSDQIMADPRVRALVEAATTLVGILEIASVLPTAIQKIYIPRMDASELVSTRAALAQLKEPKT